MSDLMRIWTECLILLEDEVTPVGFSTWIKEIKPIERTDSTFTLSVKNEIIKNMVSKRYQELIVNTLAQVTGKTYELEILISKKLKGNFEQKNCDKAIRYFLYRGYELSDIKNIIERLKSDGI